MWPGTGTARIKYGSVGSLIPENKCLIEARQHTQSVRWPNRLVQLVEPVVSEFDGLSVGTLASSLAQAPQLDAGSVPFDILSDLHYESRNLVSPSVHDPTIGCKISELGKHVIYGDDIYLNWLENEQVVDTLSMESPILQIDRRLVRTRRGISVLHAVDDQSFKNADHSLIYQGDVMHTSYGAANQKAALLLSSGRLGVCNLQGEVEVWKTVPKGSRSGWGRAWWVSDDKSLLWCNRNRVSILDPRSDESVAPTVLYDIKEDPAQITDCIAVDNDVFILSSSELLWGDVRFPKPVTSWSHSLRSNDDSLSLAVAKHEESYTVAIGSQINPFNVFYSFKCSDSLHVSSADPYLVETWPNMVVQSEYLVASENDLRLYMTTREGGLYQQDLSPHKSDSSLEAPDPSLVDTVEEYSWGRNQVDFDLEGTPSNSLVLRMDNMYKWIFELDRPVLPNKDPVEDQDSRLYTLLGCGNLSLEEYCLNMWVAPLNETKEGVEQIAERRRAIISQIQLDLEAVPVFSSASLAAPKIDLSHTVTQLLDTWTPPSYLPSADNDTHRVPDSPESQHPSMFDNISFSQPLPPVSVPKPRINRMLKVTTSQNREPVPLSQPSQSAIRAGHSTSSSQMEVSLSQPLHGAPHKKKKKKSKKRVEGFG